MHRDMKHSNQNLMVQHSTQYMTIFMMVNNLQMDKQKKDQATLEDLVWLQNKMNLIFKLNIIKMEDNRKSNQITMEDHRIDDKI